MLCDPAYNVKGIKKSLEWQNVHTPDSSVTPHH